MPIPHQVDRPPPSPHTHVVILSIMYVGRALHSDWYIMKKKAFCTRRTALSLAQMFAFLSQVMVTRRRLEPRNMLTKTSELRVRSVEGTTLPPRKKNSPALQPTDPVDHITGRERVTLEVNDQRCPLITTMRLVPLLVD